MPRGLTFIQLAATVLAALVCVALPVGGAAARGSDGDVGQTWFGAAAAAAQPEFDEAKRAASDAWHKLGNAVDDGVSAAQEAFDRDRTFFGRHGGGVTGAIGLALWAGVNAAKPEADESWESTKDAAHHAASAAKTFLKHAAERSAPDEKQAEKGKQGTGGADAGRAQKDTPPSTPPSADIPGAASDSSRHRQQGPGAGSDQPPGPGENPGDCNEGQAEGCEGATWAEMFKKGAIGGLATKAVVQGVAKAAVPAVMKLTGVVVSGVGTIFPAGGAAAKVAALAASGPSAPVIGVGAAAGAAYVYYNAQCPADSQQSAETD